MPKGHRKPSCPLLLVLHTRADGRRQAERTLELPAGMNKVRPDWTPTGERHGTKAGSHVASGVQERGHRLEEVHVDPSHRTTIVVEICFPSPGQRYGCQRACWLPHQAMQLIWASRTWNTTVGSPRPAVSKSIRKKRQPRRNKEEISFLATTFHELQVLQVGHTHEGADRRKGRLFQADGDHRRKWVP